MKKQKRTVSFHRITIPGWLNLQTGGLLALLLLIPACVWGLVSSNPYARLALSAKSVTLEELMESPQAHLDQFVVFPGFYGPLDSREQYTAAQPNCGVVAPKGSGEQIEYRYSIRSLAGRTTQAREPMCWDHYRIGGFPNAPMSAMFFLGELRPDGNDGYFFEVYLVRPYGG